MIAERDQDRAQEIKYAANADDKGERAADQLHVADRGEAQQGEHGHETEAGRQSADARQRFEMSSAGVVTKSSSEANS